MRSVGSQVTLGGVGGIVSESTHLGGFSDSSNVLFLDLEVGFTECVPTGKIRQLNTSDLRTVYYICYT